MAEHVKTMQAFGRDASSGQTCHLMCSHAAQALPPTAPILVLAAGLTGGSDARCETWEQGSGSLVVVRGR
jgi:hypothetical protein